MAKLDGGDIVLRIEDLDPQRSKQHYADKLMRDYEKLGLFWDRGPIYQSDRTDLYAAAFEKLKDAAFVYPCFCSRADLHAASAPHQGENIVYAGTCRALPDAARHELICSGKRHSFRIAADEKAVSFHDAFQGQMSFMPGKDYGDFVIRRSDGIFAYQLAVVVDDEEQGVNSVVRGCDLLSSTPQQMLLRDKLGYSTPCFGHVPLLVDEFGRRLSKRNNDAEIDDMLATGMSYDSIIGALAYISGMIPEPAPLLPETLLSVVSRESLIAALSHKRVLLWNAHAASAVC